MKDTEIRGIVLQAFYDRRQGGPIPWDGRNIPSNLNSADFYRVAEQLSQKGLLDWNGCGDGMGKVVAGMGEISAEGVDVIEGSAQSPISITFDHRQTVTIHGSNNIIGNNNNLSLEMVNSEISQSNFSDAEKAEAKSLWQKVCDNKLLNTVVGSVFGAVTKHALETTTQTK